MANLKFKAGSKKPLALRMFLLATLAFSLSTVPGHKGSVWKFTEVELSSDSGDCNAVDSLHRGSATCNAVVNGKTVKATLTATQREVKYVDQLAPNTPEKTETDLVIAVTLECETCKGGIPMKTDSYTTPLDQIANLNKAINEMIAKDAKAMFEDAEKERKLTEDKANCLVDDNGESIGESERTECHIRKLAGLEGDKAADYYEKNIREKLENLVTSDDRGERARGKSLLAKMGKVHNRFIRDSVRDLKSYAAYKTQAQALEVKIAGMPNGQARDRLVAQYERMKRTANAYFDNRINKELPITRYSGYENFDYLGSLSSQLDEYQYKLGEDLSSYDQIVERHRQQVGGTDNGGDRVVDLGGGRVARYAPSTGFGSPNAGVNGPNPGFNGSGVPPIPAPTWNGQNRQQFANPQLNRAGRPVMGTRVPIR